MCAVEKLRSSEGGSEMISSAHMSMGLSLGEYSALCFAGVFSFEDGVRLTKLRGEAMQHASEMVPTGMVSVVGLSLAKVSTHMIFTPLLPSCS
jgi:[acyl-carrier-protein] S-malonyltransferase